MSKPVPAAAVWALGATQIIGYGSLYYAIASQRVRTWQIILQRDGRVSRAIVPG